jgi:predicted RNase H-like HicB family nuclease
MIMQYTIVLEPSGQDGFTARCVEVPEAFGYGETKGDAISRIREAIARVQKTRNEALHAVITAVSSEVIRIEVADAA